MNSYSKQIFKNLEWIFFALIVLSAIGVFVFDKEDGLIDRITFYVLIVSLISSITIDFIKRRRFVK